MRKRRSPETSLRLLQLGKGLAVFELLMIAVYRWADVSWLLYPVMVVFVLLIAASLLLAPGGLVAVFGAIAAGLVCALLLIVLPLQMLLDSGSEPNPFTILLAIAWMVISVIVLVLVYLKVESYLLKRLAPKGRR